MNAGHLIRALCIDRTPSGVRYLDSVLSLVADTPVAHVSGQEDGSSYINRSVHLMFLTRSGPYPAWGIHGLLSQGDSMKAGQQLVSLLDEVERVNREKRDYLVDPVKFKSARNANELFGSSANCRTLGTLSVSVGVPEIGRAHV